MIGWDRDCCLRTRSIWNQIGERWVMRPRSEAVKTYASHYEDQGATDGYQSGITPSRSLAEVTEPGRIAGLVLMAAERESIRRLLESVPDTPITVDLPCGGGKLLPLLSRRRGLVGIDASAAMLTHFKRNGGRETIRANIIALPLKENTIGLIVCNRLLHRLPAKDRIEILTELRRVSAGWAIVYYALTDAFRSAVRRVEIFLGLIVPTGILFSSRQAAMAEIRQANWTIVAEKHVLTGLSGGHVFLLKKS